MRLAAVVALTGFIFTASPALAGDCWDALLPFANALPDPLVERRIRYAELASTTSAAGLASYG